MGRTTFAYTLARGWRVTSLLLALKPLSLATAFEAHGQMATGAVLSTEAKRAAEMLEAANALGRANQMAEADAAYASALAAAEALAEPERGPAVVKVLGWRAGFYLQQQRFDDAWHAGERALSLHREAFGDDHWQTAYLNGLLGAVAARQMRAELAEKHLQAVLQAFQRNGPDPLRNIYAANAAQELGALWATQRRMPEAIAATQASLAIRTLVEPYDPAARLQGLLELARMQVHQKQFTEAEATYKAAVEAGDGLQGASLSLQIDALLEQAAFYRDRRDYDAAGAAAERAFAVFQKQPGLVTNIAAIHVMAGTLALARKDFPTAERHYRLLAGALERESPGKAVAVASAAMNALARFLVSVDPRDGRADGLHRLAVELAPRVAPMGNESLAEAFQALAATYRTQYRFDAAVALQQQTLAMARRLYGPEHAVTAGLYQQIGLTMFEAGRYGDAEGPLLSALSIRRRFAQPLPATETEISLGVLYRYLNRFDEAERLIRVALDAREKVLPPNHPLIADALYNLAATYRWQGRCAEAEPLLRRALPIREATEGPEGKNTLADLNSLAICLDMIGKTAEAEPLLRRALAGREKTMQPDNFLIADSLVALVYILRNQGRFAEAADIAQRPLEIYRRGLGPTHPNVVNGLRVLATIHQDRGQYQEAEALFREALKIRQTVYGADHTSVARGLNDLTRLEIDRRRFDEAAGYASKALQIDDKWFGAEDPRILGSLRDLASLRIVLQDFAAAEGLLGRALAICERFDRDSVPVAVLSADIGRLYRLTGRLGNAERYYERPLEIYRKRLGERHPQVAYALVERAELDIALGQVDEAHRRYEEALSILDEAYGPGSPASHIVFNALGNLVAQVGKLEEAAAFYAKAAELLRLGAESDTYSLAVVLYNLAVVLERSGRQADARILAKEAADILGKVFGPDHVAPLVPGAMLPPPGREI